MTTYELMTAMGFLHFEQEEVDVSVFEVGLGGRLDATNVIEPMVSVVTSISLDHTHLLGNTLEEIATETGGIIKDGIPVVLAPQRPEAARTLRAIASKRGAPLVEVGIDWRVHLLGASLEGQRIRFERVVESADGRPTAEEPMEVWLPLVGRHQLENAGAAYAALKILQERGWALTPETYRQGFSSVDWPGRFQVLAEEPNFVVDAAHNAYSARRLQQTVAEYFPERPVTLVFGASEDKDIEGMLKALTPAAQHVILTQAMHPRAADPSELRNMITGVEVEIRVPVRAAVERALAITARDGVVVATGSLFVVGEVLASWQDSSARRAILHFQGDLS